MPADAGLDIAIRWLEFHKCVIGAPCHNRRAYINIDPLQRVVTGDPAGCNAGGNAFS